MYCKIFDYALKHSLIIVITLYSASLTMSTSFQNTFTSKDSCNPLIPFGECLIGEYEARFEVRPDTYLQYSISFVVALLAGAWSDCHGRRRKPLIILPIVGQILTDGLYIAKRFWYWPRMLDVMFTSIIPGLYVGRNIFWIGIVSYVSENSSNELRTWKLGIMVATYTISSLIGSGVVALIKITTRYYHFSYLLFSVPLLFNLIAGLVGHFLVQDTSDSYAKNIIWLRPRYLYKSFTALFKNCKLERFAVVLMVLIMCQSVLVARIGCEYALIMRYIKHLFTWYDEGYIQFNILKSMVLFFGTVFFVYLVSHKMKINDIIIGIIICGLNIFAGLAYVFTSQFWQISLITIIYLCHGTAVTIITSLTSKMVEIEELGRFNSIQTSMNSLLTIGVSMVYKVTVHGYNVTEFEHYCLIIVLYVILTLPILYVFMSFYSKYEIFREEKTTTPKENSIYTISH